MTTSNYITPNGLNKNSRQNNAENLDLPQN